MDDISLIWLDNKKTNAINIAINNVVKPMKYWIVIAQDDQGAFFNWTNIDNMAKVNELLSAISNP